MATCVLRRPWLWRIPLFVTKKTYDALALFSGGLDSILAVKVIQAQGLKVLGLHFTSPFFGKPAKIDHWQNIYEVDITEVNVGQLFVDLIIRGPKYGFGKILNPCVDCKILMLTQAKNLMEHYDARFLISGEVLAQRPMSQRKDNLNVISRDAEVKDILVRPLSAKKLKPTAIEESGLVDRERLLDFWGRGRKNQLRLAKELGITEIPTPGGGCRLTEKEAASRYYPVLEHIKQPTPADFYLANVGRQIWEDGKWMVVGRNQSENERIEACAKPEDVIIRCVGRPGPTAAIRNLFIPHWSSEVTVKLIEAVSVVTQISTSDFQVTLPYPNMPR